MREGGGGGVYHRRTWSVCALCISKCEGVSRVDR